MRTGFWEILIVIALIVIIFGTARLSLVKKSAMKAVKNCKEAASGKDS